MPAPVGHNGGMPDQPDLFAQAAPPGASQDLIRVAGTAATLSKAQMAFNRLSERISRLRAHLQQWHAATEVCRQRNAAELVPLQQKLTALQREAVLWIDAHLARPPQGERLPKKLRAKLVAVLRLLAGAVLQAGADAEVEAAHDRHSPQSHRDAEREQADIAAAMLGRAMGDDSLFEGMAESVDELLQRASQRLHQRGDEAVDEPGPASGQGLSRADKARLRDAKALQEASQSVRDVYRRLASSLHPDREPDAAERARKTTLMAQVNEAYARNDLLALLTVQIDIEQIDAAHLQGVPETRMRHYVRVLKDQQQALENELATLQFQVAEQRGSAPGLLAWPASWLGQVLDDDLRQVRAASTALRADMQALRDARTRLPFLRALQIDDPDELLDPFEERLLGEVLREAVAPLCNQPGPKRRRR